MHPVELFGYTASGEPIDLYTLRSAAGLEVRIITLGGTIISLRAPDARGQLSNVVLGYDDLAGYLRDRSYFGALIGRYANRIRHGRFHLDGEVYQLACNDGAHHLHGGNRGFNKMLWRPQVDGRRDDASLVLRYTSPHLEEGYPGEVRVQVTYAVTANNELLIEYMATSDHATPVNLTQHTYFNLTGDFARDVREHEITITASRYTPVDESLIPTGEIAGVHDTAFDFSQPIVIGERIALPDPQLQYGNGYDHNFVLDGSTASAQYAARVREPRSGRVLELHTSEPGMQFYSGNFLGAGRSGGDGYPKWGGLCLEPQHFPNSPNCPAFPSTILRPGQEYRSRSVYRFTTDRTD